MTRECKRCGYSVSDQYHRVNANNDGELWSCVRCSTSGETLTEEGEESKSLRYERHLDEIRNGGDLPQAEN